MSEKQLKSELRRRALGARDALDAETRIEASLAIEKIGAAEIEIRPGEIVSGFWPIRSEVDLRPLMFTLREKGARLCLPVIMDKTTIVFRELVRGAEMVETGFGTAGPGPEAAVLDPTTMLVPLAAFDHTGHRIGYGAGYYDRAIARLFDKGMEPRLIGVAFDVQEVDAVPSEAHDVALPSILTEGGLRSMPHTRS
ncbi:5-formyltetrahydrofolate cyclo-ligase [Hoeflea sp. TYP-13]|uniref:5-formyltetrahydrofolate cyclo-ligase n=1 Tax=Hoeflea sp. TYP-13 TaxID=3230023 RepID=UPI0034C6A1B8